MIKNQRQLQTSRQQLAGLHEALSRLGKTRRKADIHPLLHKAQRDALKSQIGDLQGEIDEYLRLRSGRVTRLQLKSLDELARALIQARLVAGLSQRELAQRLGLNQQQIQRYEATDYASASLARINQVARALGLKVTAEATVA